MAILAGDIKLVESAVMEDVSDATYTLTLADTRKFTVSFAPCGSPIIATPYVATVRLIEV